MRTMHKVLEIRTGEAFMGDSEFELYGLRLLREWGFPEPEPQYPLPWRSPRRGRVDFAYPGIRLIIELDGRKWHSTLDAFEEDRLRDNLAQLAGWRVLRITYRMLSEQPDIGPQHDPTSLRRSLLRRNRGLISRESHGLEP